MKLVDTLAFAGVITSNIFIEIGTTGGRVAHIKLLYRLVDEGITPGNTVIGKSSIPRRNRIHRVATRGIISSNTFIDTATAGGLISHRKMVDKWASGGVMVGIDLTPKIGSQIVS